MCNSRLGKYLQKQFEHVIPVRERIYKSNVFYLQENTNTFNTIGDTTIRWTLD